MRLVTFNLWSGRSLHPAKATAKGQIPLSGSARKSSRRKVVDLDLLAAAITALNPDVLALQEVDHRQSRSHHADLTKVAAEAMGACDQRFVRTLAGTPGAMWALSTPTHRPQGEYGIALLSRYPVTSWQELPLPALGPAFRLALPTLGRHLKVGEEPRAAVVAQIESPIGPIAVANTHLTWVPGSSIRQLAEVTRLLRSLPDPVLLVGDFNMWGGWPRRITGYHSLAGDPTYPAANPTRQLDHVLLRGNLSAGGAELQIHSQAIQLAVSDHRALVVDLDLNLGT